MGCDLVVDPLLVDVEAHATLQNEWFDEAPTPPNAWVRRFESWTQRRTLGRIVDAGARRGRLLEVGIGSGSMLAFMRAQGFEVTGCEPSSALATHAHRTHGLDVFHGTLAEMPACAPFDVVVMNHVLEHVADPVALLGAVRERMNPGALLHVAVPNVASWDANLPGWTSYEPYHLLYFAPKTLRDALARARLDVLEASTYEPFSGWFLAATRTLLRLRATGVVERSARRASVRGSIVEDVYRSAMVATGAASAPLRFMQGKLGYGEELVAIARRR